MIKKAMILIPAALIMAGCATCDSQKVTDLETRVQTLETRTGITTTQSEPSATMTTTEETTMSSKEIIIPDSPTKKDVQAALKNAGFYTGDVDGKIGPKTKTSIEDFQKANELAPDGKVGPNTWNKLKKFYVPEKTETATAETK